MTRLLLKLRCTEDAKYEMEYHCHLQGFIHNLLRGSVCEQLHDTEGSNFFSFSNIFPFNDPKKDDIRNLIISSPDTNFIRYLFDILQIISRRETQINIGAMNFTIEYLKVLHTKVPDSNFILITGTPIIIRIDRERYEKYGYESIFDNFTYWRNEQPVDVFIEQLQIKLLNKYARYHTKSYNEYHEFLAKYNGNKIFDILRFKKQISTRLFIKGLERIVIGSLWEFTFNNISKSNSALIQFALDSGLGERNSLGFGFMNLMIKKEWILS